MVINTHVCQLIYVGFEKFILVCKIEINSLGRKIKIKIKNQLNMTEREFGGYW